MQLYECISKVFKLRHFQVRLERLLASLSLIRKCFSVALNNNTNTNTNDSQSLVLIIFHVLIKIYCLVDGSN